MALQPIKMSSPIIQAAAPFTGIEYFILMQAGAWVRGTLDGVKDFIPAGAEGPEGPQGETGSQGIQGIQGPAGNDGADGTDGTNGADGIGVLAFLEPTGHFYTQSINSIALSTIAGAANRIDLAPFIPTKSFTCDQIAINVTTAVASALAKVVVYSSDANGRPDALILETGTFDLGTTGAKTVAASQALTAGTLYWVGVRHSSTATLRGIPVAGLPSLGVAAATASAINTMVRRTLTFATAAPSSWVFAAGELASAIAPTVFMRST
jgi:hypothetical protein